MKDSFLLGCYVMYNELLWKLQRNTVPTSSQTNNPRRVPCL